MNYVGPVPRRDGSGDGGERVHDRGAPATPTQRVASCASTWPPAAGLSDLEHIVEPGLLRAAVSTAIIELERARHDAQRLLFLLLQAEGQSMTGIARTWGISRQLVSRLVNESTADGSS